MNSLFFCSTNNKNTIYIFLFCISFELGSNCYKFTNSEFFKIQTINQATIKQDSFSLSMTKQSDKDGAEAFIVFFFKDEQSLRKYQTEFSLTGFYNPQDSFRNFFLFNSNFEETAEENNSNDGQYFSNLFQGLYGKDFWKYSYYKYCYSDHCVEHIGSSFQFPETFMETFYYKGKRKIIASSPSFVKIKKLKLEKIYRTYETVFTALNGGKFVLVYTNAVHRTRDGFATVEFTQKRFPQAKQWFQSFEEAANCNSN